MIKSLTIFPSLCTDVRLGLPPQSVNTTHALNRSAGVSNSNDLRGNQATIMLADASNAIDRRPFHNLEDALEWLGISKEALN